MAEPVNSFNRESSEGNHESMDEALSQIKSDISRLVDGFDIDLISEKIEEFGKANPVGLALTAMGVGLAVGVLMKQSRRLQLPQG